MNRGPAPWQVGEIVEIVYDPSHPERADLVTEVERWRFWLVVWCVVAALPAAFALVPVVLFIRQRRT